MFIGEAQYKAIQVIPYGRNGRPGLKVSICRALAYGCLRIFQEDSSMTLDEFRGSLTATEPPPGLTHALAGMWWDGKGDWKRAHESAQQDEGIEGSWVHAYLHRKEGDQGNAAYWYSRAGKPVCREPLDAEWLALLG